MLLLVLFRVYVSVLVATRRDYEHNELALPSNTFPSRLTAKQRRVARLHPDVPEWFNAVEAKLLPFSAPPTIVLWNNCEWFLQILVCSNEFFAGVEDWNNGEEGEIAALVERKGEVQMLCLELLVVMQPGSAFCLASQNWWMLPTQKFNMHYGAERFFNENAERNFEH